MQIYLSYLLDLHEIVDYHIVHSHRAVPHMPSNWFKTTNNTMCQILKVTYMSCLGRVFESLTNKIQILEDSEVFGTSGFWFWAIEPVHKTGNDGKLPVWLNLMLFYCSVFFETADYNFCLKELLWICFLLLSVVSGVFVESTWPNTFA